MVFNRAQSRNFVTLPGFWEEGAKRGYAQVVFMIGVVLGMVINFILLRIEARTSEKTQNQE